MGLMQFTTNFYDISKQEFLRLDINYRNFFDLQKAKVYTNKNYIKLKDVLVQIPICKINKGNLNNLERLIDLGNIEKRFNNLINIEEVIEIGSDKNIIKNGDIIIPKIQPQMGNVFLNLNHKKFIVSTELIEYKIKNSINPYCLYYLITHGKFLDALRKLESGKTHRRVISNDLLKIKIPLIPKKEQDKIVSQIEPIEQNIKKLKSQIIPNSKIINEVFAKYFSFDLEKFQEIKKENFFEIDFFKINTKLIRSTIIQNKNSSLFLKNFLNKNSLILKDILIQPIKRGKQPVYTEYGIKVIKTLNIQNGKINYDGCQYISKEFFKDNKKNATILKYDLLLSSTGMGRGKFALYENEEISFADSHISIIKFNQNIYLPFFLNFYCQSFFGYEQLKYIEMHIKGTPEIYEAQLNYFKIPNISLSEQQKIVDEIQDQLDKQEYLKQEIVLQRNRIDQIIEDSIIK